MTDALNTAREALESIYDGACNQDVGHEAFRIGAGEICRDALAALSAPQAPTAAPGASWWKWEPISELKPNGRPILLIAEGWDGPVREDWFDAAAMTRALENWIDPPTHWAECPTLNAAPPPQISEPVEAVRKALEFIAAVRPGRGDDDAERVFYSGLSDHERAIYDRADGHTWSRAWCEASDRAIAALSRGGATVQDPLTVPEAGAPSREAIIATLSRKIADDFAWPVEQAERCVRASVEELYPTPPALKASDLEREGEVPSSEWLRDRNLIYTLEQFGWDRSGPKMRNRLMVRVEGGPGATDDEVDALIDRLHALLSGEDHTPRAVPLSTISEGWRPIETAPKDDESILGICASAYDPIACVTWWVNDEWRHYSRPVDKWHGGVTRWFPTHWMPLPAPPAPTQDAETGRPDDRSDVQPA